MSISKAKFQAETVGRIEDKLFQVAALLDRLEISPIAEMGGAATVRNISHWLYQIRELHTRKFY